MKSKCLILLLVLPSFALLSQTLPQTLSQAKGGTRIFIAPCTGGNEAESLFFDENFAREIAGAGYTLVQNETEADYRINLQVEGNAEYGEYEDAKPKIINIALAEAKTSQEIIRFAWEYENPEEMTQWGLVILFQSIPVPAAEAAAPPSALPPDPDRGRNKWLYALAYGGIDFTWFLSENIMGAEYTYTGPFLSDGRRRYINTGNNQGGIIRPLAGAGVELQFLNYLSAETGLKFRFNNVENNKNVPVFAFPLYLKFPFKPGRIFMLEPYAGIELNISTSPDAIRPAVVSAAWGFQFGIWGGAGLGVVFTDANISVDLGLSNVKGPYGEGKFQRIALGFSVGYKFGFYNRSKNNRSKNDRNKNDRNKNDRSKNTASAAPQPAEAGPFTGYDGEYGEHGEDETGEDVPAEEDRPGIGEASLLNP
ncbi:MAG: hypothetical protein LBR93_04615 [Treponema sp.]|jgi:hypothetical protein|nr:hypothetical protein [Treponema sp.]